MNSLLKQSSTARALYFLMVDSTDHVTGKTGLSPTVTICKEGGSFAAPAGAVSEVSSGWYKVAGNATDTGTLGSLLLHATGTAADPVDLRFDVVAFDPADAVRLGLTALPNAAADAAGGLPISDAGGLDMDAQVVTKINALPASITAAERNVRQTIESQRGHHTGCGSVFYVQKGGSDANPGTYLLPFLTIQAALNACTANAHDTVVVLGVAGQAPSVFDEALTMSKAYVFLRGMGRDTKIIRTGAASKNITISANGCEVSGFWINNTGSGATEGISLASGSDFAWLHHLFIDGTSAAMTGIEVVAGANTTIENCRINDVLGSGIDVAQGAAVGLHTRILSNHIDGCGTGINFAGGDSSESVARYNNISGCTTGVVVASGALKVQVTDNRFSGNTTDWTDAGTNTNLSWNALSTSISGAVSRVTLADTITTYTGNTPQTGDTFSLANGAAGFVAIDAVVDAIKAKTDNLPTSPAAVGSAMTLSSGERSTLVDLVWDELLAGHVTANSAGQVLSDAGTITPTQVADAVWGALRATYEGAAGTYGQYANANLTRIAGSATVDGLTLTAWYENILAHAAGDIVRSVNTYDYKKQDGVTTAFSFTSSAGGRS